MASIFNRDRKKSATLELNEEPPEFELLFLGKLPTERKMGRECTTELVGELVEQSRGKELKHVRMTITCRGIWVIEGSDPKKLRETFIPIYSISYGAADKQYARVFSFVTNFTKNDPNIARGRKSNMPFQCYAFVCRSSVIARVMVVYLLRSFKTAYEGWRREVKSKRLRDKIKAGPGHNSFGPRSRESSTDEKSVANTIARLDELMAGKARSSANNNHNSNKLSPRQQGGKPATPPDEAATRADKVMLWMDKWIGSGLARSLHRISSDESSGGSMSTTTSEITAARIAESDAFAEREEEFENPAAMLNSEVDIVSELLDPEIRNAMEEMAGTNSKSIGDVMPEHT